MTECYGSGRERCAVGCPNHPQSARSCRWHFDCDAAERAHRPAFRPVAHFMVTASPAPAARASPSPAPASEEDAALVEAFEEAVRGHRVLDVPDSRAALLDRMAGLQGAAALLGAGLDREKARAEAAERRAEEAEKESQTRWGTIMDLSEKLADAEAMAEQNRSALDQAALHAAAAERRAEEAERERDEARGEAEVWRREAVPVLGGESAREALRDDLSAVRGALAEWVSAHDAERRAAKAAARVRVREYAKWPTPTKRTRAVLVSSLPPDEQRRIGEQCEKEMAPIKEAEAAHGRARGRLEVAIELARSLAGAAPGDHNEATKEE